MAFILDIVYISLSKNMEDRLRQPSASAYILYCYDLKSLESDNRTTLVLSNTRKLDRVPSTK